MSWNIQKVSKPRKLTIKQSAPIGDNKKERLFKGGLEDESRCSSLQSDDTAVHSRSVIGASNQDTENQLERSRDKSAKEEPPKEFHKSHSHLTVLSASPERSQKNDCIDTKISICEDRSSSRHNETNIYNSGRPTLDKKDVPSGRSLLPSSTYRRQTPEKIPYFIDEVRERDRLRRKYGIVSDKRSSLTVSSKSRRSRSAERSHYSSPTRGCTLHCRSISRDRYARDGRGRYNKEKPKSDKSKNSIYRHRYEDGERNRYRHRSFHSSSRSRSPSRERITRSHNTESTRNERRKYHYAKRDEGSNVDFIQRNLAQTQIITIPVPVPTDFLNYPYLAWPAPTQWNPHLGQPPRYGARASYPILPATAIPPVRPPFPLYGLPHPSMQYGGRGVRFRPNYEATRPWHQHFRGRNS